MGKVSCALLLRRLARGSSAALSSVCSDAGHTSACACELPPSAVTREGVSRKRSLQAARSYFVARYISRSAGCVGWVEVPAEFAD